MLKFATALVMAASLAATTAAAQQTTFRFGLRAGASLANQSLSQTSPLPRGFTSDSHNSLLLAGQAGLAFEAQFGWLAFQPSLLFSQKGVRRHGSATINPASMSGDNLTGYSGQTTTRTNWLEMPLNLVYTPQGDHGFQLFAGPYVALAVGGRETGSVTYTFGNGAPDREFDIDRKVRYGENTGNRRLDYGFNAGLGYRVGPLQVQAGYSLGLRNLHSGDSYRTRNHGAQVTATYFWGK